jgi:hypothetical protein
MQTKRHGQLPQRVLQTLLLPLLVALTLGVPSVAKAAPPLRLAAAPTAEAAVGLVVAGFGTAYAGDCAATRSPDDIGKACSKFVAEQAGVRAYLAGRTFSEYRVWIFVQQNAAGWQLVDTQSLDESASSPTIPWPSHVAATGAAG